MPPSGRCRNPIGDTRRPTHRTHGYSALATGLAFLVPMAASLLVGAAGTITVGVCLSTTASYLTLVPGLLVLGLGQGAGYTVMFGAATAGIDTRDQGVASGLASTTQQIGGAVGLAVLVAIANTGGTVEGLRAALFAAAAGIVVAAVAALGFTPSRRRCRSAR